MRKKWLLCFVLFLTLVGCQPDQTIPATTVDSALIQTDVTSTPTTITPTPATLLLDTPTLLVEPTHTPLPIASPLPTVTATAIPTVIPEPTTDPTVHIALAGWPYYSPRTLIAEDLIEGVSYSIVPIGCVIAGAVDPTDSAMYPNVTFEESEYEVSAINVSISFEVQTDQAISIDSVRVELQTYEPPPNEDEISQISIYDIPGWMSPPTTLVIFLEEDISPRDAILNLNLPSQTIELMPNESQTFVVPLRFQESGTYTLRFVASGVSATGDPVELTTQLVSYGWLKVQETIGVPINSLFFTNIALAWVGTC